MSRLVVVSNRVAPVKKSGSGAEGGLAVAVLAALRERGGLWFGWSGKIVDGDPAQTLVSDVGKLTYATVDLSQRDFDEYYNGFANGTLWPLFHYRLDLIEFNRRNLAGYLRANEFFASRLLPYLKSEDLIWVHDYHLIPMAEQLRYCGCKQRIGFFLHIPWPAPEVLTVLPNHETLVRALSAYDVVGFQTEGDLRAFCDYITREVDGQVDENGIAQAFGRSFKVGVFPIGIDTDLFTRFAEEVEDSPQTRRLKDSLQGRDLIIGVDRLDYSKGLVQRMQAFEFLLRSYPANRGRVVMLQIAPPTRGEVQDYMDIRQQLESIAGHVNGRYAEFDWVPIRYLNKSFRRKTLAGFFRISRIGLVTPLRDGMNLVAKEFVAAQPAEDPGVLVLSRFTGAAQELDGALLVNPHDIEAVGEALQEALSMALEERQARWSAMYERLRNYDITAWRKAFLEDLVAAPYGA